MTTKMIDTDMVTDEMREALNKWISGDNWNIDETIKLILEAATSMQAEPVAYAIFAENGNIRMWSRNSEQVLTLAETEGLDVVVLCKATPNSAANRYAQS